jgi:hypothetical protein
MMVPLTLALRAARELGPHSLVLYAAYHIARRTGWLRNHTPIYDWDERPLAYWLQKDISADPVLFSEHWVKRSPRFFFAHNEEFSSSIRKTLQSNEAIVLSRADEILQGQFRLFGIEPIELGFPPDWASFPRMTDEEAIQIVGLNHHWTEYDLDALPADVKLIWEPSRFGWIYSLARAFILTDDERYYEGFWRLVESWRQANRPNAGLQWYTAQTAALRLMALVFAMHAFAPALMKKPVRMAILAQMVAVHADRIPPTLIYARAQGNNHLLTEAVALYTAGLLFPDFRRASRWKRQGCHWLIEALNRQIFPDGGYVQHSTNYHRVALHIGLWGTQLAKINGEPLPPTTLDALRHATQCLAALVQEESGHVSNFGPNDSAHILPLSICPREDFRPVIQAASLAFIGSPAYDAGPWDEICVWLGLGDEKLESGSFSHPQLISDKARGDTPAHRLQDFPNAGLYIMRGDRFWGMLRCAEFTNRPGHSDQLHFDLWWRGLNIACDPGTYLYNGSPPWDNGLACAAVHNTLIVDGRDPMDHASRFLWLDWAQGRVVGRWKSNNASLEIIAAEHYGYQRAGVIHRRTVVRAGDDLWLVIDDVLGQGTRVANVAWLMPDMSWRLEGSSAYVDFGDGKVIVKLEPSEGIVGLYRKGELAAGEAMRYTVPVRGWRSTNYGIKEAALHLIAEFERLAPFRVLTWWIFDDADQKALEIGWRSPGDGIVALDWVDYKGNKLDISDAHFAHPSSNRPLG